MEKTVMGKKLFLSVLTLLLTVMLCLGISTSAIAQNVAITEGMDVPDTRVDETKCVNYKVGIGPAIVPDYEGSNDYEVSVLPLVHVEWKDGRYISLLGPMLRANLLADKQWNFGPMLYYRAPRNSDVNDQEVEELRRVNAAAELGAFGRYNVDRWSFLVQGGYDVADGHEGFVATAGATYTLPVNPCLKASLGAYSSWASDKYMNAYFKIDADNSARSGLPEYSADSGIKDVTIPLKLTYQFQSCNWGVMGVAVYKRMVGDAEDSPVVDDEGDANQYIGGVMATYCF